MKYYIIVGEASGDLHASNLVRELRNLDPSAEFRGWGGDLMAAEGVRLARHFREVAFMGFLEVARNLGTILKAMKQCKRDILENRPDLLILVDYPGFNLRIAEFAHKTGLRVVYYISPQVWAWKPSRVHTIRRSVDKMLVILPFEKEFYARYGVDVDFVGHPLLDVTERPSAYPGREEFISRNRLTGKPVIALLPGSRQQEITRMLPVMAQMAPAFPDHEFIVAAAPSQDIQIYQQHLQRMDIRIIPGQTYEILRHATAALVTSGTATLETALFGVPQVVCYNGSSLSYQIARRLVRVDFISLVNLVMGRQVVRELIQHDYHKENLRRELTDILEPLNAERIKRDYHELKHKLGDPGASLRAAEKIIDLLK